MVDFGHSWNRSGLIAVHRIYNKAKSRSFNVGCNLYLENEKQSVISPRKFNNKP